MHGPGCLNEECTKRFLVVRNRQAYRDCFEKVKTSRGTIKLGGISSSGKDYTGKSFSIVDSDDPRDEKRGGWKVITKSVIPVRSLRLRCLNVSVNVRAPTAGVHVFPQHPKVFFGADSCTGIGATGIAAVFHDGVTPVDYAIEGINSDTDALIPVEGSGVATFIATDRMSGQTLILKCGGMLKCDPKLVSSTVGSSWPCADFVVPWITFGLFLELGARIWISGSTGPCSIRNGGWDARFLCSIGSC